MEGNTSLLYPKPGRPAYPGQPSVLITLPGSTIAWTKPPRLSAEASATCWRRIRPIPFGDLSSTPMTTRAFPSAPRPRFAFLTSTDISFVYLNAPRESVSSRSHHSPSKFVQPLPGCLIAAWLNDSSKAKSVSTVFLGGNVPHRAKPQTQGLAGAMKNRAGRYGSLDPTLLATPKPPVRPPRFIRSALRAHKPIRDLARYSKQAASVTAPQTPPANRDSLP